MEVVGAVASFIAIGQAIAVIPKFVQFVRDVSDPSKELLELVKELERLQQYHYFTSEAIGAFSNADLANGSLPDVPIPPYIKMIWQDMVDLMHQLEEHLVGYGEGQKLSTTKRIRQMKWLQTPKDTKRLQERCAKITRELEGAMTIYALSVQKAHYEITVSAISSARRSTLSVVDSSEPMLAEAPGINPRNELQAKPCKPDDTSETQTPDRIPTQPVRRNLVRETIRSKCDRRMLSHMPGSQSEITFGELLADIRDREIQHEAARLEDIIRLIQLGQTTSARENLQEIRARKLEAGILEEAETFRVVDLQLQDDMAEPAIESLEEFIEVSRARLAVHPFCEEQNDPIYYQDHRRTCENCRDPNELLCDTESDTDESDIEPEDESENESDDESD
ncbi:hypothetical protein B0I35DRAFT_475555 [Stachybotrys elegans]|uniref:Fungal N-terminal domain-containing protein n=1 Tax=Stachybotrys elegans TaxID=80388 RepID=A0A8K0SXI1_9HYPO|nr:hypothetical protein B0I35DRAFT_475555 [Stachybotrys elegans]